MNLLTGPVPSNWLSGLSYLDINSNPMTCNSKQVWPTGITVLKINGLNCIGSNPSYPDSLQYLQIGMSGDLNYFNKYSGTLILKKPTEFYMYNNLITNVTVMDTSVLTTCDISGNPLLGSPSIATLTMCTQNGLYSASLLPYTISSKVKTTNTHSLLQNTRLLKTSATYSVSSLSSRFGYFHTRNVSTVESIPSILLFI